MNKEFNLLDEPWLLVTSFTGEIKEVSLLEIFKNAENYVDIAGETPAQYVSLLRLLLAVVHTVVTRENRGFNSPDDALKYWQEQWGKRRFNSEIFDNYFKKWHERFWLIHPDFPFYQVPSASYGTACTAAKLHGELLESNNKYKLFRNVDGAEIEKLDNPETARWLITLINFDDASLKKKRKDAPSIKPAWAGRLGGVYAHGCTLFETLWLNTVLLNSKEELYGADRPAWELQKLHEEERTEIPMPDNIAELLTLQSRRVALKRENGYTTGYNILGGDFFDSTNAFIEPYTIWGTKKEKGGEIIGFCPLKFKEGRHMWRSIPILFPNNSSIYRKPEIEHWLSLLKDYEILEENQLISFKAFSFDYGSQSSAMEKCYADTLTFGASVLESADNEVYFNVISEISKCDKCADYLKKLWVSIETSKGKRMLKDTDSEAVVAAFYHSIDGVFRSFFYRITTTTDKNSRDTAVQSFEQALRQIALQMGENLVLSHTSEFFKVRSGSTPIPEAFLRYKRNIHSLFPDGK